MLFTETQDVTKNIYLLTISNINLKRQTTDFEFIMKLIMNINWLFQFSTNKLRLIILKIKININFNFSKKIYYKNVSFII